MKTKENNWKGRINIGYRHYAFVPLKPEYTINLIDKEYEERFQFSFHSEWLIRCIARFASKIYQVPIHDSIEESRSFCEGYKWKEEYDRLCVRKDFKLVEK